MQISTKGRYAITAMLDLASDNSGGPITLSVISQRQLLGSQNDMATIRL